MTDPDIAITVKTRYLAKQSQPEELRHAFAYDITIENRSPKPVTLLSRHWIIIDGNEKRREVKGEGVVGEQPRIEPGARHNYTSGVILETPVGTMEGAYRMQCDDGGTFDAPISPFLLAAPGAIN
jgi:ApaG protein